MPTPCQTRSPALLVTANPTCTSSLDSYSIQHYNKVNSFGTAAQRIQQQLSGAESAAQHAGEGKKETHGQAGVHRAIE